MTQASESMSSQPRHVGKGMGSVFLRPSIMVFAA